MSAPAPDPPPRIRELLVREGLALTPSEEKIVQRLLADYPMSGIGAATTLAKRAGVSDPTVARFVSKLGFPSYVAFQARLLEEVEAGLRSPLMMMSAKAGREGSGQGAAKDYLHAAARAVEACADAAVPQIVERAAGLILSTGGRVLLLGGRFSRHLAGMLAAYLAEFRADVSDVGALSVPAFDLLLDLGRRDLLIVFDYRRYQTDIIRFAEQAAEAGVPLILFTDAWRSPIARWAEVVFTAPTEVPSPYDTLAPALSQVEALLAHMLASAPKGYPERMKRLDQLRRSNAATLDG